MARSKRGSSRDWRAQVGFALAAVVVPALLATPQVALASLVGEGLRLVVTPSVSLSTEPLGIKISGARNRPAGKPHRHFRRLARVPLGVRVHVHRWPHRRREPCIFSFRGPQLHRPGRNGPGRLHGVLFQVRTRLLLGRQPASRLPLRGDEWRRDGFCHGSEEPWRARDRDPRDPWQGRLCGRVLGPGYGVQKEARGGRCLRWLGGRLGWRPHARHLGRCRLPDLGPRLFQGARTPPVLGGHRLGVLRQGPALAGDAPGVDSRRLWVAGGSRGSEAALLVGVHYPGLVHGVVALVPSDAAICSYPGCTGPAWTFQGKAVPFTRQFDDPHPSDDPAAVIPVAKIKGPVFLDCGGFDQVWSSCPYADAIMAELAAAHDPYPHMLMVSQKGGHGSGLQVPYEPGTAEHEWGSELAGTTAVANNLAWAAQWPRFIGFLEN